MTQFDLPQEPSFENPQAAIRQLWDRQVSFEKQMAYYLRNLEAANFNETGLKDMTAPVYKAISDTDGKLLAVELTAEGAVLTATDAAGAAASAQLTAEGASLIAQNAAGAAASLQFTVDGLGVTTSGGTTTISGDHIKSGTIEGVTFKNSNGPYTPIIEISAGNVLIGEDHGGFKGNFGYVKVDEQIWLESYDTVVLKIKSGSNMSIDAKGAIFIGSSDGGCNVEVGAPGSNVWLNGNVFINGILQGAGGEK